MQINIDSSKSAIFIGERWCEAPFIHKAALSDVRRRPAGHDLLTAPLARPVRLQRRHVFFARLNPPSLAANGVVTVNIAVDCSQPGDVVTSNLVRWGLWAHNSLQATSNVVKVIFRPIQSDDFHPARRNGQFCPPHTHCDQNLRTTPYVGCHSWVE